MASTLVLLLALASNLVHADLTYYKCIVDIKLRDRAQSEARVMIRGTLDVTDSSKISHQGPLEMAALSHASVRKFSSSKLGTTDQPTIFEADQILIKSEDGGQGLNLQAVGSDESKVQLNYRENRQSSLALNLIEEDPEDHLQTLGKGARCDSTKTPNQDWEWTGPE